MIRRSLLMALLRAACAAIRAESIPKGTPEAHQTKDILGDFCAFRLARPEYQPRSGSSSRADSDRPRRCRAGENIGLSL